MSDNITVKGNAHENTPAVDETSRQTPDKLPDVGQTQANTGNEDALLRERIDSRTEYLNSIKLKIS